MTDQRINRLDPSHKFSYVGKEFGPLLMYWYTDRAGNYWLYTNAPEGHPEHDPLIGEPFFNPNQPVPSVTPEFFSPEGLKLSMMCENESSFLYNTSYNPKDRANCWYGTVTSQQDGVHRFVYLDKDVRENLYLYVQQQVRVVDAQLTRMRKTYSTLFTSRNQHDKLLAAALILMEQGMFSVEQLVSLKVKDLDVKSDHLVVKGKRLSCDSEFFDFMVSLVKMKDMNAPLLSESTFFGDVTGVTVHQLYSVMAFLNLSPKFLPYAKASITFSQIVHKNLELGVSPEVVETISDRELSSSLFIGPSVKHYVNPQLRKTLLNKYQKGITKSFGNLGADDTGLIHIDSSLSELNEQEQEYSQWLHSMPLHALSADEVGV